MRVFDPKWLTAGVARTMRRNAEAEPFYDGLANDRNMRILERCKGMHLSTGTGLLFTRDQGMHSSGWWKNSDYERCYHLSLSFVDPITHDVRPKDTKTTQQWLDAFFGDDQRHLWAEPPYSDGGKARDVWHYRLFCDLAWKPLTPRKEVYSKDFTPAHWLSFSDLKSAHAKALAELEPGPGEQ